MNDKAATITRNKFQGLLSLLLNNWHFMRWLRLAIGLFLLWQVVVRPDIFTGIVAAFFLFQAITNTGCCGASGCAVPEGKKSSKDEEIKYEEIK